MLDSAWSNLKLVSPLDGRYQSSINGLPDYFSEYALIKYRLIVEGKYLLGLADFINLEIQTKDKNLIYNFIENISDTEIIKVKEIEKIINHDVKAVEYVIKGFLDDNNMEYLKEYVHFGLTSEDINNTAYALMVRDARNDTLKNTYINLITTLNALCEQSLDLPMLARTHGQSASPTTLGKEIGIFINRLIVQLEKLFSLNLKAKLNGATGNYNAFQLCFPEKDWLAFSKNFLNSLGLEYNLFTTQIEDHDTLCEFFDILSRINNILADFSKDFWQYISYDYFKIKLNEQEVGSSTMPHKVNPIDFENAEGNLGVANSLLYFMKDKLSKSRLQRDLSDSTVLRNIGVAISHSVIAYNSLNRGLKKLSINTYVVKNDLNKHPEIISEGIQSLLRINGFSSPYEQMKTFTRGNKITNESLSNFMETLELDENIKKIIKNLDVESYIGLSTTLAKQILDYSKNFIGVLSK